MGKRAIQPVATLAQRSPAHIDFQMSNPLFANNPELRKAIASCVNRQDLVDKLIKSVDSAAVPLGNFIFQPNESGYEDHYAGVGTGDVPAAKALLEGAGWTLAASTSGPVATGELLLTVSVPVTDEAHRQREDPVRRAPGHRLAAAGLADDASTSPPDRGRRGARRADRLDRHQRLAGGTAAGRRGVGQSTQEVLAELRLDREEPQHVLHA